MKKVFLGGTCNGSLWRDELIRDLKINYFNPVGDEWTPEMMKEEIRQRETADFCLYVITPKTEGFYSIAEIIDDSNKRPSKTIFCFLKEDEDSTFSAVQIKSLNQVAAMVKRNGASYFETLDDVVTYLNNR